MRPAKVTFVIGVLLILTGIFVPSSTLVHFLRTIPVGLREQLLLGAVLFKFGLGMFGLFLMIVSRMGIWKIEGQPIRRSSSFGGKKDLLILVAIILAALALRVYALNFGLWYDEIMTYVKYVKNPFGEILSTFDSQNQHPLYSLLAHVSFVAFGESTWALRLPAVVFGIGSIWALYLLGCQVSSVREALLSSTLLALSYHHIWFSQNARGYTGLLFWTVLSSWVFLRGLEEGRPRLWVSYAMMASLGVYTHMTMLFVILGHFVIYLVELFRRRKEVWQNKWVGFILGFCLSGLLTFQLHALVLPQLFAGTLGEKSTVTVWKHPLWTVVELAKGMQIGFAGSVVALLALVIFTAGVLSFVRTNPVLLQLLFIPAVVGAAVVIGMGHHLWPRFFFFTIGFGALITIRGGMVLGEGVSRLLRFQQSQWVPIGTTICAALVTASALSIPFVYAPKQDYRGALAFVEWNKQPEDAIVTVGLATIPYKRFYKVDWELAETVDALNAIRFRARRTWLLYTLPLHLQSVHPHIMDLIRNDFRVVKRFDGTLRGGTIFVCRSDIPPLVRSESGIVRNKKI